ncbi:MAG: L-2-hydroxyglutarate oxidase [Trueperaceae bacterium]|nr:L-2-hydroxyglutarate oxidase [Trueperaceae bacterium]
MTRTERIEADLAVIGGGIVGLATARAVRARWPQLRLVLLEKEDQLARHQTGHNSGVVHAGLYYRPGSLKARLCMQGGRMLRAFCRAHDLPYQACGKVVTATREADLPRLEALHQRAVQNGVPDVRRIDGGELRRLEPHAAGLAAIHSPHTAITDFTAVSRALAHDLDADGVRILTGAPVRAVDRDAAGLRLDTPRGEVRTARLVGCAGLHADRFARLAGVDPGVRIVPFRGEYVMLRPDAAARVRGLIYPVPDPDLPFLGVHVTRTVHGEVEAGPNAVLAFAREGYRWRDVNGFDLAHTLAYPGFWRLAARYGGTGAYEVARSLNRRAFVRSLQRLMPDLRADEVRTGGAGVRAQAVDGHGRLVDDFHVVRTADALHVLNAPSPAATASLAIGEHLAGQLAPLLS